MLMMLIMRIITTMILLQIMIMTKQNDTSESTIEVDDLFSFEDKDIIYDNENSFFNYCVNCGKENLECFQNCADCEAPLFFEFYDKK